MKTVLRFSVLPLLLLGFDSPPTQAQTNVAPTVSIVFAGMRAGTTLMDVVFRVEDPDDATVKVRALAFKDGVRSFANVIRPVTFVEGTADKIGDAIPANTTHTVTWNVGADWNIDLGQAKFEVLAMDGRGLLSFDWITIPAAGGYPQVTVSTNSPSNTEVLNALFWQYASADPGVSVTNGVLSGTSNSGVFWGASFATNATIANYAAPFVMKRMDLAVAKPEETAQVIAARGQLASGWLAANRPYSGFGRVVGWGNSDSKALSIPNRLVGVTAIDAGNEHGLALKSDGTVVAWGDNGYGQTTLPTGLTGVIAIAAGSHHSLALKSNGTVVAWGGQGAANEGQANTPVGLTGVTAIAAGGYHNLALKNDGTVVGWGWNTVGQCTPPTGLTGVTAIAAGEVHSLALKGDGTVVGWGASSFISPPAGLTGVVAIAANFNHSLALKSDGTVVAWGDNAYGQTTLPNGLAGVIAIAAAYYHNLALKGDGTVVAWGDNTYGQATPPANLTGITSIVAAAYHSLVLEIENGP